MKYSLFDEIYDTKSQSADGMKEAMTKRLQSWLGNQVSVSVELIGNRNEIMEVTLNRQYGEWYEDPKRWSDCNETINSWDETIFLGDGYQTGCEADFSQHTGHYIIRDDIQSIFLPKMKEMAKKHHASKIKAISVDNNLDHVTSRITVV